MIVYHGSNSNFRQLRISSTLTKYESTMNNEGPGIYFSTDKNVARSYGKWIYILEINDRVLKDFRNKQVCIGYVNSIIKEIQKKYSIDISKYFNVTNLVKYINFGGIAVSRTCHEIQMLLDSECAWYEDVSESKIQRVYQTLRGLDKRCPAAYMFSYNIKNIGVIKRIEDNVVRILSKESAY